MINRLKLQRRGCFFPSRCPGRLERESVHRVKPCHGVFWLNDDRDSSGQDAQTGSMDSANDRISHVRDLEDLAQIALKIPTSIKDKIVNQNYKLAIQTTGGLQVNVFKATQAGTGYVFDRTIANQQINGSYTIGGVQKFYNRMVDLNDLSASIKPEEYDNPVPFIFEGKTAGEGVIKLVLKKPDNTVELSDEVHVKLMKAADMFERAHAKTARADNRFRLPWEPPRTYVDLLYEPPNVSYSNDTPNFQAPPGETQQLVTFVHGFNMPDFEKQNWSETMFKRLWWKGFKGRFASFFWPTPEASEHQNIIASTEFFALKYGKSLKGYLEELEGRLSGYTINVTAHSAGNIVMEETLKQGMVIDSYVLMQAAVPASSYDNGAPLDPQLVFADGVQHTPDSAQNLGYRGYLQNVQGKLVNFFNPADGVLQVGFPIGPLGFINVSWFKFQRDYKPYDTAGDPSRYFYGNDPTVAGSPIAPRLFYPDPPGPPARRQIINAHESMTFVARSRTRAVGALAGVHGEIDDALNLNISLGPDNPGFQTERSEHSAQFNRPIQRVHLFYERLKEELLTQ